MAKIYNQKHGNLNDNDLQELGRLLLKAGYTVRLGKERPKGKTTGAYIKYVEYLDGTEPATTNMNLLNRLLSEDQNNEQNENRLG